jgi:hypothetical protein
LVQELTLLQTRGFELCLAIVGSPMVQDHLSEGMRSVAVYHTEMVGQRAALWVVVSSVMQSMLRHSPNDTFQVEVVDEVVIEFQE